MRSFTREVGHTARFSAARPHGLIPNLTLRRVWMAVIAAAASLTAWTAAAQSPDQPPEPAHALGAPLDVLFEAQHLDGLTPEQTLVYTYTRQADPAANLGPDLEQTVTMRRTGETTVETILRDAEGRHRILPDFGTAPGNPLVMVFLEQTTRAVAKATGGSPFYIRNRMRAALRDQLRLGDDGILTLRPFAGDRHAARLGAFADLTLTFDIRPETPGMVARLAADAPGYHEAYRYEEIRSDAP